MATAQTVKRSNRKTATPVAIAGAGLAMLDEIASKTLAGSYVYTTPDVHLPLIEAGLVEINENIKNEAGAIATRATEKCVQMSNVKTTAEETSAAINGPAKFAIEDNVPMPEVVRKSGGGRTDLYPFDQLKVGQSFFVPASESKPQPHKSLASTITSANARYSVPKLDESGQPIMRQNKRGKVVPEVERTREFKCLPVEGGARVWRVK